MWLSKQWKFVCAVSLSTVLFGGLISGAKMSPAFIYAEEREIRETKAFHADFSELGDESLGYNSDGLYTPTTGDAPINTWVNEHFNLYFNREDLTPIAQQKTYLGQSSFDLANEYSIVDGQRQDDDLWCNASVWQIHQSKGLFRTDTNRSNNATPMRKSDFLTLKGPDGELARLTNMEVSVDFVHQKTNGAVFVSMHEQIPGYYAADSVAHTSDVIGVGYYSASGTEISGTLQVKTGENNETNKGFNDWWTRQVERDGQRTTSIAANAYKNADGAAIHPSDGEKLRLTVKAVGTKITVKVTSLDNNTVYEDREIDNGSSGQEGTLSIGVGAGSRFVQCITVRQLDDSGNPVDFGSKCSPARSPGHSFLHPDYTA